MRVLTGILFFLFPALLFSMNLPDNGFQKHDSDRAGLKTHVIEFTTLSGKSFQIRMEPESEYLYDVYINGVNFPDSRDTVLFDEIEHVDTIITADLNNDGFGELYLFTRGFKPGEYAHIFGIASDGDKTYKEINFPDLKSRETNAGGPFEGYNGKDVYKIKDNILERTFPVHIPGDTYENAKGGYRTLYYTIEKTEEGFFYKQKN